MKPIVASEGAGPVFGGLVFGAALAGVVVVVGALVGSIEVALIVDAVLAVVAIVGVLSARGAYVDYARESVLLWRGGFPRVIWKRIPLRAFQQVELREEVVSVSTNRAPAGAPDPDVSVDPKLVAFIDLIGPVRIQLAQADIVGCEEKARAVARRLRMPLRLANGAVETPHQ